MKTKIKSVTVITAAKNKTYTVGETYNGLVLDYINDASHEYPAQLIEFFGYTKDNCLVFDVINAPIEVQYEAIPEEPF